MEKKQNVPALRFQGFSGEWKERKIEDITGIAYGGGTPSTQYAGFWQGTIPWIQSSDVIEDELWSISPRKHISKEAVKYSAAKVIPKNSIAIITRVGVGKVAFLPFDYATSQDFLSLSRLKIDERFGTYAVWKKINADAGLVQGTSIKGITREEVLAKIIKVPVAENEAKQIGSFFYQFDKKIGEIKSKIQKLQQFRQAMLAKLFPREGAAEPELRFRGFSGKWKCCRFGDIADIRRGLTYSPSNLRKSGIRVLRASNIQDDTFYIREDDVFVEPDAVNIPMVKNGDILIAAAGGSTRLVGKHAVIYGVEENSAAHGGFMLLASSDYPEFTNALMGANWYRHFVQQFIAGGNGAIGNLNKSDLEEQIVFVPDVAEMEQIGNFFKNLDTYISLQQKKLERMQRLKAALLEKLFV